MSLTARDLMETDVETVAPDDEVSEVLGRLARADFNGFPVVEDGVVVGIVTQHDLVHLFQTEDRVLWLPIGLPPFTETLTYAIDVSWDDLDLGIDLVKNANRPISEVMTSDVVTVTPDTDLDTILDLLADDERDINRLPVVESEEPRSSESSEEPRSSESSEEPRSSESSEESRSSENRPVADDGRLVGIVARQDVLRALRDERRESKR